MGQEIVYCSRCQTRIVGSDFEKGDAFRVGDESLCGKCGLQMLNKAPVAVQQQILEQKKRALDRKSAPALSRGLAAQAPPAAPKPALSGTGVAVLAGIGLTLVLLVGMLVMSGSPPPPPPPAPPAPPKVVDTGPSPRDIAGQGALKVALSYLTEHPSEFAEQARLLEKVASDYSGTSAAADARRELETVARKRKEAAAAELTSLLSRAREMGVKSEYQKAVNELEAARKKYPEPEWTRPIDAKVKELSEAMSKEFPPLRDRATEARKRDASAEVQQVQSTVAKWGSARYAEDLEKALSEVFPPIAQRDNGNFMLRAIDGTIVGKRLKRFGEGDWSVVSDFKDFTEYVEWSVVSRQAGAYTLKLNYAVPKEYKGVPYGGEVTMTVGDQTRTFALENTKLWGDFTTFSYGTVPLPSGPFKVTIRAAKVINNLMSLRFVQFVPVK